MDIHCYNSTSGFVPPSDLAAPTHSAQSSSLAQIPKAKVEASAFAGTRSPLLLPLLDKYMALTGFPALHNVFLHSANLSNKNSTHCVQALHGLCEDHTGTVTFCPNSAH